MDQLKAAFGVENGGRDERSMGVGVPASRQPDSAGDRYVCLEVVFVRLIGYFLYRIFVERLELRDGDQPLHLRHLPDAAVIVDVLGMGLRLG